MQYQVRALDAQQQVVSVNLDAFDESDVQSQLQRRELTAISMRPSPSWGEPRRARFSLLLFAQELHALLIAGLSVTEALDVLINKESADGARTILVSLAKRLSEGKTLSDAMALQPGAFPPLFVGIIKAAEGTSDISHVLSRYIAYETRLDAIRQKVISAAIYPVILSVVGGAVAAFLMGYVVPRFAAVYRSSGRALPWASQLLLDWGQFAGDHAAPLVAGTALLLGSAALWIGLQLRRGAWWRLLSMIPGTRPRLQVLELSRLYLTLGMLLESGMPILAAIRLAGSVLPPARRSALEHVGLLISHGEPLSEAMAVTGLMAPLALRLIKVGERSGQLGLMLNRTAEFYEAETTRWMERFTKAFEPVLMAGIGVVIGVIILLLYMPIFDLAGTIR